MTYDFDTIMDRRGKDALAVDDGVDMESNSIGNQRKLLNEYVQKIKIFNTIFFVDDGYSGTDFNRPDFQRMQAMVERGEIGTIIVKDLSRFARILFSYTPAPATAKAESSILYK